MTDPAPPAACDCGNPALIVLLDEQGREVPVCEACLDQGIRQARASLLSGRRMRSTNEQAARSRRFLRPWRQRLRGRPGPGVDAACKRHILRRGTGRRPCNA